MENNKTTIEELETVALMISPFAYIAGGFYKDIFYGKEPKDIDVFMNTQNHYKTVVKLLEDYEGVKGVKSKVATTVGRFEVVRPLTVFKRRLWGKAEDVVSSFDISIAQVYIDSHGLNKEINKFIDLEIDWKVFTAYVFEGDEERTMSRVKRYVDYGYACEREINKEITLFEHFVRQDKFRSKRKTSSRFNKSYSTGGY